MFSCFSRKPSTERLKKDLCFAILDKNPDKVRAALALDAPVDFPVTLELRRYTPAASSWGAGITCTHFVAWESLPLAHLAAMLAYGDTERSIEILKQIIDAGASLDEQQEALSYETSGSILHNTLTEHNHVPTFALLLEKGANPLVVNSKGHSVIHALLATTPQRSSNDYPGFQTVAQQNKLSILKMLLDENAKLDDVDVKLMLKLITNTGKITTKALEVLSLCIEKQIDISPTPDTTILHLLADNDLDTDAPIEDFVNKAVALGVPVDKQDEQGRTALYISLTKNSRIFKYLAPFANANLGDTNGVTPLHLAAKNDVEQTRLLIDKGADVTDLDNNKRTVMHYTKDQFVFDLLLANGAKVDEPDSNGITPLMCATEAGKLVLISKLLIAGADITATDKNGRGIIFYAQNNAHTLNAITGEIALRNLRLHSKPKALTMS